MSNSNVTRAVNLHYTHGLPVKEVASRMGEPLSTVYTWVNDSEEGREAARMVALNHAELRLKLAKSYLEDLDELEARERELLQARRVVASKWALEDVEGRVEAPEGLEGMGRVRSLPRPIVVEWTEVTDVSQELFDVYEAQRKVSEQIEDLLGLEAADRVEVSSETTSRVGGEVYRVVEPGN